VLTLDHLRQLPISRGISQAQLAAATGISRPRLSTVERGLGVTDSEAEKLASALQVTTDLLTAEHISFTPEGANRRQTMRTLFVGMLLTISVGLEAQRAEPVTGSVGDYRPPRAPLSYSGRRHPLWFAAASSSPRARLLEQGASSSASRS
jgi:transcriptional regulator with XRE-family HTH domain